MPELAVPRCPQCSNELPRSASFCPTCGNPTPATVTGGAEITYHPARPDAELEQRVDLQRALGAQYELRALLGRGGFAEVYEAWDTALKRTVAVKTLRRDITPTPELLERFRREAEAIAKVRHPHIIPIYAVGGDDRRAFFIMPRVDGESLADALRREGRIPVDQSCRILREAADALAAAHRAGILHRDVKPENIMLDGPDRRVLMMDFGIAKGVGASASELTGTGTVVGTPHYMSPEQASGERALDARSDQYSLAVVAFRMLSGELPFDGDSLQSVIMKQITAPARPVGELAPDVPAPLGAIIDRALAKKPADRFASLDDFAAALRDVERDLDQSSGRRERITGFKNRVELMRSRLPGWRHPLTLAAVVAVVATGVLKTRPMVPYAYEQIGEREAAQFAAQELLSKRGVSGPFHMATTFGSDSLNYEFLQPAVGRDSVQRIAAAYGGLWHWTTTFRRKADGTVWRVATGAKGGVHRWTQLLADSAHGANATEQRSDTLALAELRQWGIDPTTMSRRADSTITRVNRTDRIVRGRHPGQDVVSARGDTAWFETQVRVSGDKVSGFWRGELVVPPRFRQRASTATSVALTGLVVLFIVLAGLGIVIWLVSGPMRRDPPDWRVAAMVAGAVVVFVVPDMLFATLVETFLIRAPAPEPVALQMASPVIAVVFIGSALLVGYVCADFLSAKRTSADYTGLAELVKGRLRVPELVSGAAIGGIAGSFVALSQPLLRMTLPASMIGTSGGGVPGLMTASFPALDVLGSITAALLGALYFAGSQSLLMRWTKKPAIAVTVPVLAMLAIVFASPAGGVIERITAVVSFAVLSAVAWRFGVLSAALMVFLSGNVGEVLALVIHPSGATTLAGLVALAVLSAPFVFAVIAYRKVNAGADLRRA